MKKILITGANGLLGQKLVALLAQQKDVELIATAIGPSRFIIPTNVIYQSLDITCSQECICLLKAHLPDAIIHAAAMTQVDTCETEKEQCDSINIKGV